MSIATTIYLDKPEDRRRLKALTRCADESSPSLFRVAFVRDRIYATDGTLIGTLSQPFALPDVTDADGKLVDRLFLDARTLRDALGMVKGSRTPARLELTTGGAVLRIGHDPLPGFGSPEVRIPYDLETPYPDHDGLMGTLAGDPDDGRNLDELGDRAAELIITLGINATSLGRLAALAADGDEEPLVTLRPRTGSAVVEVHADGERLGVMARLRTSTLIPTDPDPTSPTLPDGDDA